MKAKKNMMIGVLCIALVFMGLGYSLYSSILNLTGTATASGTFDVKITNVELDTTKKTLGATNQTPAVGANYAVTETTLTAKFSEPGDYITWNITVTNRGSIEATITVDTHQDENGPYKLSCNAVEGTVLAPNQTTTFPCEMSFDKNRELTSEQFAQLSKGTPVNMTVSVTAVQSTNYEAPPLPEEHDFIINDDGVLLFYAGNDTQVRVPDSYNGQTITAIGSYAVNNVGAIALVILNNNAPSKAYILPNTSEQVASSLTSYAQANNIEIIDYDDLTDIVYNSNVEDPEGRTGQSYVAINSNMQPCTQYSIASLDLSEAVHLETIYSRVFTADPDSSNSSRGSLQSVIFPSNGVLENIGAAAFYYNSLTSVVIPDTVTYIGAVAFGFNNISNLTLGSSLESIEDGAFLLNNLGPTVTIPSNVQTIGEMAFAGNNLSNVIIGTGNTKSNIQTIKTDAFSGEMNSRYSSIQGVNYYINHITSVIINLTQAEWDDVTKGESIFQWDTGYSDSNIVFNGHN